MASKKIQRSKVSTDGDGASESVPVSGNGDLPLAASARRDLDWLLKFVHDTVPLPTREEECADGSLIYVGGDPGEVIVRVSSNRITVSIFAVYWKEPQTPGVNPLVLTSLNWKRIPQKHLKPILKTMIDLASELRRAKFQKCHLCGETKPPEWMHDGTSCQGCVEQRVAGGQAADPSV